MLVIPGEVRYLLSRLEQKGYEGYLVGGCVRDALLGLTPKDWDLCTSARPEEVKACFYDKKLVLSGSRHGTVGVVLDGHLYEITSYRTESGYTDGRHPDSVTFVRDLKEDLARRDFTVNAMAYHPEKGLIDPWKGRKDLVQRVLRCVGNPNLRFQEDALRILRGMRFTAAYGFHVEKETARAAISCRDGLKQISKERIQTELCRFLTESGTGRVLFAFWPVFAVILPECGEEAEDWKKLSGCLERASTDLVIRIAVLLSQSTDVPAVLSRLRLRKKLSAEVQMLLQWKENLSLPLRVSMKYLLRDLGQQNARRWIDYRFALEGEADCRQKRMELLERILTDEECFSIEQLAINGQDLAGLGFTGPQLGACLYTLLDQVIMGKTKNTLTALKNAASRQKEDR